jgi:hypothetical protein
MDAIAQQKKVNQRARLNREKGGKEEETNKTCSFVRNGI